MPMSLRDSTLKDRLQAGSARRQKRRHSVLKGGSDNRCRFQLSRRSGGSNFRRPPGPFLIGANTHERTRNSHSMRSLDRTRKPASCVLPDLDRELRERLQGLQGKRGIGKDLGSEGLGAGILGGGGTALRQAHSGEDGPWPQAPPHLSSSSLMNPRTERLGLSIRCRSEFVRFRF